LLALISTILQLDLQIQNSYPWPSVMSSHVSETINMKTITIATKKKKNNKPQTTKPVDNIFPLHLLCLHL